MDLQADLDPQDPRRSTAGSELPVTRTNPGFAPGRVQSLLPIWGRRHHSISGSSFAAIA